MHEDPEMPNYGKRGRGKKFIDGMVLAIEPMINMGVKEVVQEIAAAFLPVRASAPSS